jgi:putative phosphoesterase
MRILLVSDIHSNWPALEAVQETYDICLFLGDLVDYGVEPEPCIDWVRRHCRYGVRGNHDHGAAQKVAIEGVNGFRYLTGITRLLTVEKLNEVDRRFLADLPIMQYLTLSEKKFLLVHATPRDPLDEYGPPDVEFWKKRIADIDADVICVGHTHRQAIIEVDGKIIINPGSVGLARDGDPRAGYAIISSTGIELKRIEYPFERSVEAVQQSNLPRQAKDMMTEIYRTGQLVVRG